MIGYFPYFTVALLLIHPHSTTQSLFMNDPEKLEELLHQENAWSDDAEADTICDSFTSKKRQDLCDEAMGHVLRATHRINNARLGRYSKKKSTLPVHDVAKSFLRDPYTCQTKSILGRTISMEKNMYWCNHRVYRTQNSEELQVSGFFVSGTSRHLRDTAFLFVPASLTGENVRPLAKLSDFERDLVRSKGAVRTVS